VSGNEVTPGRLVFTSGPGAADPSAWEMTPEREAHWDRTCERLIAEAVRRGGAGWQLHGDRYRVHLQPPLGGQGERIDLQLLEAGSVLLTSGWTLHNVFVQWAMTDDEFDGLGIAVLSIMDGEAEEYADVDADGEWVAVGFRMSHAGESFGAEPGIPAARRFTRHVPPWRLASPA